jgi:hypothetical protein
MVLAIHQAPTHPGGVTEIPIHVVAANDTPEQPSTTTTALPGARTVPDTPSPPRTVVGASNRLLNPGNDIGTRPFLVFESTNDASYGNVAVVSIDRLDGPRYVTSVPCDRVDYAADNGLCLAGGSGPIAISTAYLLDTKFQRVYTFPLFGLPSRARLSPDGRYGAVTTFVTGDSYTGSFSTRTTLLDVTHQKVLGDLESFDVSRDGQPMKSPDFNFWGVTFSHDGTHFYATLGTGGMSYLIQGDLQAHTARVLYPNVQCPSLSPDETRIAFKKGEELNGVGVWRLTVLNLSSMTETPLAETRSVDDQAEWLDNDHLLYSLPTENQTSFARPATNVWEVPADGSGAPRLFLTDAYSPTVLR